MTKTRQVAQRVKVEGGVALTGRMWWNLVVVTGSCWCTCWCGTGLLYKIRGTSPGLGPPHFVGVKVEGGGVALTGRMWSNLVDVTGSGWCTCWCGAGLLYKIRGTSPGVGLPHFVE